MTKTLDHTFIDTIPEDLEEGILYISLRFRVTMHLCCCGCKNKVVTPLSPARWHVVFDGKTISLCPSIGNWNFDCESHYWIENSKVVWAGNWSRNEVAEGKEYERKKRKKYFEEVNKGKIPSSNHSTVKTSKKKPSLIDKVKSIFKS